MRRVIILILVLLIFIPGSIAQQPVGDKTRDYYFQVNLSQWSIEFIDLNNVEDLILGGTPSEKAIQESTYVDKLTVQKNSKIYLQVFTTDISHSLSSIELELNLILEKRDYSEYTFPIYTDFISPTEDQNIYFSCSVYCGIGHNDMKFTIFVGDGEPNFGSEVLYLSILVNLVILTVSLRFILKFN